MGRSNFFERMERELNLQHEYEKLELFWNYKRAFAGDKGLAHEIVLNMVMEYVGYKLLPIVPCGCLAKGI